MNFYREDCREFGVKFQCDYILRGTGFRLIDKNVCYHMRAK